MDLFAIWLKDLFFFYKEITAIKLPFKRAMSGVPTVAQWVKNLIAVARITAEMWV